MKEGGRSSGSATLKTVSPRPRVRDHEHEATSPRPEVRDREPGAVQNSSPTNKERSSTSDTDNLSVLSGPRSGLTRHSADGMHDKVRKRQVGLPDSFLSVVAERSSVSTEKNSTGDAEEYS